MNGRPAQQALNQPWLHAWGRRISTEPDAPVKVSAMTDRDDPESLKARSEQALGELAQALLDSQMLENAVAAAFGAREKAIEAQKAAMAALNLPSAEEVERLERRLRSLSQRFDDVEDLLDRLVGDVGQISRSMAAGDKKGPAAKSKSRPPSAKGRASAPKPPAPSAEREPSTKED
jgi:hypothetical protein